MGNKKLVRILRALSRQGLDVKCENNVYSVRWQDRIDSPRAEVLLPQGFPVEAKALKQLANLAIANHPEGGYISRVRATPDFHPGDSGIAIGSVVETVGQIIPAAVGSDINCGMRLHVANLSKSEFLARRDRFVELMKGDYFFGTRDVTMTSSAMQALWQNGLLGWLDRFSQHPTGNLVKSNLEQLLQECDRVFMNGSFEGDSRWVPEFKGELIRDDGLATIGGGNHFVEIQEIERVEDRSLAYHWGIKKGQIAFTIHSGSRHLGKYIGTTWRARAREVWPKGLKYPESCLFPLSAIANPELVRAYLQAEATATNYGFLNRLLLAELLRLRLREVYGDKEAPLIYDLPHNITLAEGTGWVTRKGSCPAHTGQPAIIPGSMGSPSYLVIGLGKEDFCCSASHGAGRARSRFELKQQSSDRDRLGLTGIDCITLKPERAIEEAPVAYKEIDAVIDAQVRAGMISVVAKMQPILTFKA